MGLNVGLDQYINSFINILGNEFEDDEIPTEEELVQKSNEIRVALSRLKIISDEEFKEVFSIARSIVTVKMEDMGATIEGNNISFKHWLNGQKENISWKYWDRFRSYMNIEKNWSTKVLANLNRVSDDMLDLAGNPNVEYSYLRRGLIIGDVQSGKTATYTALCNKAADAGYKVIIVLTGMQEDLRQQTQKRLDLEFAGRNSAAFLDRNIKNKRKIKGIGVAKYNSNITIAPFTSVMNDFKEIILKSQSLNLDVFNTTVLFVVKKNVKVLQNLSAWLDGSVDNQTKKIHHSLLLIDDEADNASVNTNRKLDDPTAINKNIREILDKFERASYVGVTATPYANIFINPDFKEQQNAVKEDLFPKDYIMVLDYPSNYIGPDQIFGDDAKYADMLVRIPIQEVEQCFPAKHKKEFIVEKLPESLLDAMSYFLLVNAVRDARGDKKKHRSMLIHISRFVNVQQQIRGLVDEWLDNVRLDLENYGSLAAKEADKFPSIARLHRMFDEQNVGGKCGLNWSVFLHKFLIKTVQSIDTCVRNQKSADSLDYTAYPEGLRVIAVGGNSFARGLTLEGLCVTYFYRNSKMYDTLMQMGRWFGYRPKYADLCRIWLSDDAIRWYAYINRATNELKQQVKTMMALGQTPMQFGLRVRQEPASLIVTARNKMRDARPISVPVSVSGRLLETINLRQDDLAGNEIVFKDFVKNLGQPTDVKGNGYACLWSMVPKDTVSKLLQQFKTDVWNLSFSGMALSDYVRNKMEEKNWDVVIASGSASKVYTGLQTCSGETILVKPINLNVSVHLGHVLASDTKARIGSGSIAKLGLSQDKRDSVKKKFLELKEKVPSIKRKHMSNMDYLNIKRNPLLILYVIYPKEPNECLPEYIFGLGVGFPGSTDNTITANYVINTTEYRTLFADNDDDDFEDGDEE